MESNEYFFKKNGIDFLTSKSSVARNLLIYSIVSQLVKDIIISRKY